VNTFKAGKTFYRRVALCNKLTTLLVNDTHADIYGKKIAGLAIIC
jgi:hypothetical protein